MIARTSLKHWMSLVLVGVLLLNVAIALGADDEKIDWNKTRGLLQKENQGQALTADEKAYLDHAREVRHARQAERTEMKLSQSNSTGFIPLTDMTAEDKYKGQDGGLYGGGQNRPPKAHADAAAKQIAAIGPLDGEGNPSPAGKVVMISIGMSNTHMAFAPFSILAAEEKDLSPHLVMVNCSRGGMDVESWIDPNMRLRRNKATIWQDVDRKLAKAGVTAKQVQVAWMKHAKAGPARDGEFPAHAKKLSKSLGTLVALVRKHCPNLRVMYVSSRTYAGYATSPTNPEPYSYESGFSVRWLIDRQIAGEKQLNYDPARGAVVAPLLLWGPYLWADGVKGRKIDELIYKQEDYRSDGTHPSKSGQQKIGRLLLKFFKTDPLARTWFLKTEKK